jgi:von Willebrand factor type A domain
MRAGRLALAAATLAVAATLLGPASPAAAEGENPPWPHGCPLRVSLVLDLSGSMRAVAGPLREASKDLVDSLRGSSSEVTVIGFASDAWTVAQAADVKDEDAREALKDKLNDVKVVDGATNWQQALVAAEAARAQLVVMVTDGYPNAIGSPPVQDNVGSLEPAGVVADRLRRNGTRIVVIAMGQGAADPANLARISGPVAGDDYYVADAGLLLRQLYDISSKACGIPVQALPQPIPDPFPWRNVLLAVAGVLALLIGAGMLAARRARGFAPRPTGQPVRATKPADPTIHRDEIERELERTRARHRAEPAEPAEPAPTVGRDDVGRRSMSLDFLNRPDREG